MLQSRFAYVALSALLVSVLVSSSRADTLATIDVTVLKQGVPENQGIQLSTPKLGVGVGDNIRIVVDSGVFCPGAGAAGTVTVGVPVNGCGFTAGSQVITEGGALNTTLGPAGGGVTNFNITITYLDAACGLNDGPASQTLAVNCNGVLKKSCSVVVPGKGPICTPNVTLADCTAQGGIWNDACVPTVSEWGVAVMAMLVLTAGTIVVMRRRAAATA